MITKRQAIHKGKVAGENLASWAFDGNTNTATYETFLKGYEDGDPMVMDQYAPRAGWLSGEEAGASMPEVLDLGEATGRWPEDEERVAVTAEIYEEAAERAYWRTLVRTARRAVA